MSSRSSPLLATPRSPCPESPPEPYSEGVGFLVANLDYRMSRKDLQQILHDTFSRYGRVRPTGCRHSTRLFSTVSVPEVGFVPILKHLLVDVNHCVQVKAVELSPHTDYQLKATIQMSYLPQPLSAVSGLHRYKIGGKRIQVSLITGGSNKSLTLLRY